MLGYAGPHPGTRVLTHEVARVVRLTFVDDGNDVDVETAAAVGERDAVRLRDELVVVEVRVRLHQPVAHPLAEPRFVGGLRTCANVDHDIHVAGDPQRGPLLDAAGVAHLDQVVVGVRVDVALQPLTQRTRLVSVLLRLRRRQVHAVHREVGDVVVHHVRVGHGTPIGCAGRRPDAGTLDRDMGSTIAGTRGLAGAVPLGGAL